MTILRTALAAAAVSVVSIVHASATPEVVVSIKPVHSLVASVMDGVGTPKLIVDGAASPHSYSLRPSQARDLSGADVVFWVGHELEACLEMPTETLGRDAVAVELLDTAGLHRLGYREGAAFEEDDHDDHDKHGHDHGHDNEALDPHIWLDPVNAEILIRRIAQVLADADPANAARYRANAAAAMARLAALGEEIEGLLAPVRERPFVVFHDAYHYFEARFRLHAAGSVTVSPETVPGAARVREIQARIRELGATCVFTEPQFTPKLIQVVTEGTEARTSILDPLGASLEPGPDLYGALLTAMASSFRACLEPRS